MRRAILIVWAAAAVVVGPARADGPPSPPSSRPEVLAPGEGWTAPEQGGLCLTREQWIYQVELRRYYETRIQVAEKVAERRGWYGAGVGFAAAALAFGACAAIPACREKLWK